MEYGATTLWKSVVEEDERVTGTYMDGLGLFLVLYIDMRTYKNIKASNKIS